MAIAIQKQLAGAEDIMLGQGQVSQDRGGVQYPISKLNSNNIPYSGDQATNDFVSLLAKIMPRGVLALAVTGGTVTLTVDQFNNTAFDLTGVLTSNLTLVIPDGLAQMFIIDNATTGAFTVTVKHATTVGIITPQAARAIMYTTGLIVEGLAGVPSGLATLDANTEVVQLSSGATAEVAAGRPNSVKRADGVWIVPVILQVVSKPITTQSGQTIAADIDTQVGVGVDFILDVVPKASGSSFLIEYRWFGEADTVWSIVFNVHRDGVRVNNTGLIKAGLSMATQTYPQGVNNATTPEIMHLRTLDKSGSTAGTSIQFKLVAAATNGARIMFTNRCYNPTAVNSEHGVSEVIITEIAA